MNFATRYKKLNQQQRQAVDTTEGPVMVIAGPGTGKTELLSMRAANILQKTDAAPENILCLTFTESGQTAMQERLAAIAGSEGRKVAVHTFHSFAAEVMNRYRYHFFNGARFQIADELNKRQIIESILTSLDHDHPLKLSMNGAFTTTADILAAISDIKRSGMTEDELRAVLDANNLAISKAERLLGGILKDRVAVATAGRLKAILPEIVATNEPMPVANIPRYSKILAHSLQAALDAAETSGKTTPLTEWKRTWMTKDNAGTLILKAHTALEKLRALLPIYSTYLQILQTAGFYDYDDMIMGLVHVLETQDDVLFDLQEQYQYFMVDEFQDTNLAQMRILDNLTNNPVNEGAPNVLVVGDDDQAIYSFQGAEVGNIFTFHEHYPQAKLIPLTDNYRSAPIILEASRQVITQSDERLEAQIATLNKALVPQRNHPDSHAETITLSSLGAERQWIAQSVRRDLDQGIAPQEIAILARRNSDLEALVPFLHEQGIAVSYDRRENVLENEVIVQLEQLARLVSALANGKHDVANALLPKFLSHPSWQIAPQTLWRLSLDAWRDHKQWLELMQTRRETAELSQWLLDLAAATPQQPLERMLDILLGTEQLTPDGFQSPLRDYFFSDANREEHGQTYLTYLEGIRTLRDKLREHLSVDTTPQLGELVTFIDAIRSSSLVIAPARHIGTTSAIQLLTTHAAKGMEFDTVYLSGATENLWGQRRHGRSSIITYPENLRLRRHTDSPAERLRLFFVGMTRAKRRLVVSSAASSDDDKPLLPAYFLENVTALKQQSTPATNATATIARAERQWHDTLTTNDSGNLASVLHPYLAHYKLSATHLNRFLDVTRGGPRTFLLENLLHFPTAMAPAAAYGSAMHATLQHALNHLLTTGSQLPEEDALRYFEAQLGEAQLAGDKLAHFTGKGTAALTAFWRQCPDAFNNRQRAELSFSHQNVQLNEARLNGTLDVVELDQKAKTARITDYKTGTPLKSWDKGNTAYGKIKAHHYRQQLLFYDLLMAQSRDFHGYTVIENSLQFIEPNKTGVITSLSLTTDTAERERLEVLISGVWQKIIQGEFPDTSHYSDDLDGIKALEQDIIDNTI